MPRLAALHAFLAALVLGAPAALVALPADADATDATAGFGAGAVLDALARAPHDLLGALPLSGDAPEHEGHEAHAGHAAAADEDAHLHERVRTAWPPAEGEVPESGEGLEKVSRVTIEGAPTKAQRKELSITGTGSLADPFVLEGLHVTSVLELKDTEDYYVIRENYVDGTLKLNWNADNVHVHHNYVRDLRVNQNIERTGDATGGLIEKNVFGVVGQIRHFDGVFRENEVGPAPAGMFDDLIEDSGELVPWMAERIVLNIDGFDGAVFEANDIVGYVEMQLHGHHHGSCFDCHSHNHGDEKKAAMHDHTIRYHEAVFRANTITVEKGVAFRYTDQAHRGDDRTATSEPEETLRDPHEHFTRILIADNTLVGGPLFVDVFNADSRDHANEETTKLEKVAVHEGHAYRGDFVLRGNTVRYELKDQSLKTSIMEELVRDGILVRDAKETNLVLEGNVIELANARDGTLLGAIPIVDYWAGAAPAGIHLRDVRQAHVDVRDNAIAGPHFGVLARDMPKDATWTLSENEFVKVVEEVDYDETVANEPEEA
jgi:hypothetical protein